MQNEPHIDPRIGNPAVATTATAAGKLQAIIADLATDPDIVATVKAIESDKLPTTRNNYGRYLAALSPAAKEPNTCRIMAMAMVKAGANKQGIYDALQILGLG